jgi:hypothetical protein
MSLDEGMPVRSSVKLSSSFVLESSTSVSAPNESTEIVGKGVVVVVLVALAVVVVTFSSTTAAALDVVMVVVMTNGVAGGKASPHLCL